MSHLAEHPRSFLSYGWFPTSSPVHLFAIIFFCVFFYYSGDKVGLVSLSWCPTALKLGAATSFCLLHTHLFLSFSRLVSSYFAYCITHLPIYRILYQLFGDYCIFPVHSQFINKLVSSWSMFQSPTSV